MNKGALLTVTIVISALMLSLIAFPLSATAQGPNSVEKPQVVSALGKVPGKDLIVDVLVVVPPGADKNEVANEALRNQGARPFTHDEYSTIALFWDQFGDNNPGNDFVTQNYNPKNDPTNGNGETALLNTHSTWNNVATSNFAFNYGGETGRCPSLVQECKGPQKFDGNNDVAWLRLSSPTTLGVTWSGTSTDEADTALNTNFNWATNGINDFDVETVFLHENGHALGLGHSDVPGAVMEPVYDGVQRSLHQDDIDGITFLYPAGTTNSPPTVTIQNPADGSTFNSGDTINFAGIASDPENDDLTASLVWNSSIDGPIGTGGSFSRTLSNGNHVITAFVTDSNGASGTDSVSITVGTVTSPTTVSVSSITYGTEGGKNGDKHLLVTVALENNLGNPVSGASVSIDLSRDGNVVGSGTGTTGSSGTVTFTLKNAAAGSYSTTITGVSASGLTWDGITPSNGFTKQNSSSKPQN